MFIPGARPPQQQPSQPAQRIEYLDDPLVVYETQINELAAAYEQDYALERRLVDLLHDVTLLYENDERYRNNPRYLQLWLMYASFMKAPLSIYKYLQDKRIGESLATFYEALARVHAREYRLMEAERVLKRGLDREAQPIQRLRRSYEALRDRGVPPASPPRPSVDSANPVRPANLRIHDPFQRDPFGRIVHPSPSEIQSGQPSESSPAMSLSMSPTEEGETLSVRPFPLSIHGVLDQIEAHINNSARVAVLQACYRFDEETSFEELHAQALQYQQKRKRRASTTTPLPSRKKITFAPTPTHIPRPTASTWRHPTVGEPLAEKRQAQRSTPPPPIQQQPAPQPPPLSVWQQQAQKPRHIQARKPALRPQPKSTQPRTTKPVQPPDQQTPDQQTPDRHDPIQRPAPVAHTPAARQSVTEHVSASSSKEPEIVRLPPNTKAIQEQLTLLAQQSPHYHDLSTQPAKQRIQLDRFAHGNKTPIQLSLGRDAPLSLKVVDNLGQGGMANVFLVNTQTGTAALKVETPANPWEFYVLIQLHARQNECRRVITARALYVYRDTSFLLLEHARQRTLLDALNTFRTRGQGAMPEPLVMLLAKELVLALLALHRAHIVHCDLKLDNVMLAFTPVSRLPSTYDPDDHAWSQKQVQIIDFGRAIDLTLFAPHTEFIATWPAVATDPPQIRQRRSWLPWIVDYWGLAAMVHLLLFGQPLAVVPTTDKHWRVRQPWKRYWHSAFWSRFFHVLLNPTAVAGPALPLHHELAQLTESLHTHLATQTRTDSKLRSLILQLEAAMVF